MSLTCSSTIQGHLASCHTMPTVGRAALPLGSLMANVHYLPTATDSPYRAAHDFIERERLDPMFLDQIAKFIVRNTTGVSLTAPAPAPAPTAASQAASSLPTHFPQVRNRDLGVGLCCVLMWDCAVGLSAARDW
jgi:hypothetical protein